MCYVTRNNHHVSAAHPAQVCNPTCPLYRTLALTCTCMYRARRRRVVHVALAATPPCATIHLSAWYARNHHVHPIAAHYGGARPTQTPLCAPPALKNRSWQPPNCHIPWFQAAAALSALISQLIKLLNEFLAIAPAPDLMLHDRGRSSTDDRRLALLLVLPSVHRPPRPQRMYISKGQ